VDANDPTWIRGRWFGSALSFGGDDFIRIPSSRVLEPQKLTRGTGRWRSSSSTAARSARAPALRARSTPGCPGEGTLGGYRGSCQLLFTGDLDNVKIWNQALPIADIRRRLHVLLGRPTIQ
jgi:hypothetical protein